MADNEQQNNAGTGQTTVGTNTPTNNPAPTPDLQAQINLALTKQQQEFSEQLKAVTGHGDIKALHEHNLLEQGKLKELAETRGAEAQTYKSKWESANIGNAILSAAIEAVDPAVVKDLLAGRAKCDENGTVTIDGKSVAEAVNKFLEEKPFLAKAKGGSGSGAPNSTQAANTKSRAEFEAMNPGDKAEFIHKGGTVN